MTHTLALPNEEQRKAAFAALEQGEFHLMQIYLEQSFAWYEQAARPFDREAFVAAMKARGEPCDERLVRGAKEVSDSITDGFRKDAANFAFMLGLHSSMCFRKTDALIYLKRAVELDPSSEQYRKKLAELEG